MLSRSRLRTCAVAVAMALVPVAGRASDDKPAPAEAKHADAKPVDVKAVDAKAKAADVKPAEAKAKPADAKSVETKPGEAKVEAKPGETKAGDVKAGGPKSTDAKAKDGKPTGETADGEKEEAAPKTAKPLRKKKPIVAKEPAKIPGEGPSPASPPPLTMGGLRDEVRREAAVGKIDAGASPRTKVEQMLTEIVKTREALHGETLRLEAMMAQEQPEATAAAGAPAGGAGVPGKPAAKNPLDILAKALRGIKPEQAAPIVSRLDKRLAATVLQRMPPVDAGKIMGAMKPDTAAELATQIAIRVPEGKK